MPHVIGPGTDSWSSTSIRRLILNSFASVEATEAPCDHGNAVRRSERICQRPMITGARKIAAPITHAAKTKSSRVKLVASDFAVREAAFVAAPGASVVSAKDCTEFAVGIEEPCAIGSAIWSGGAMIAAIGKARSTANPAARIA